MVGEGERRVSALASRVHAHPRLRTPSGLSSSRYFEPSRVQPHCLVLVDPTDEVLEDRGNPFSHAHKMKATTCLPDSSLLHALAVPSRPDPHASYPIPFPSFSLFPRPRSPPSWPSENHG
jgi:hypothetical protein